MKRTVVLIIGAIALASLSSASATALTRASRASGVFGTITAGPTCPVERVGHPCPPAPVSAPLKALKGRRVVASTHSDSSGRYAMSLRPGQYSIVVSSGRTFPRCPTTPVTVHQGQAVRADIRCDTGIR